MAPRASSRPSAPVYFQKATFIVGGIGLFKQQPRIFPSFFPSNEEKECDKTRRLASPTRARVCMGGGRGSLRVDTRGQWVGRVPSHLEAGLHSDSTLHSLVGILLNRPFTVLDTISREWKQIFRPRIFDACRCAQYRHETETHLAKFDQLFLSVISHPVPFP